MAESESIQTMVNEAAAQAKTAVMMVLRDAEMQGSDKQL